MLLPSPCKSTIVVLASIVLSIYSLKCSLGSKYIFLLVISILLFLPVIASYNGCQLQQSLYVKAISLSGSSSVASASTGKFKFACSIQYFFASPVCGHNNLVLRIQHASCGSTSYAICSSSVKCVSVSKTPLTPFACAVLTSLCSLSP